MSELTIPTIAITTDPSEWNSSNNIADTLTDVEDLEEANSAKITTKLKIKLTDNGSTTDVEDLEGSDFEEVEIEGATVDLNDLHLDSNFHQNIIDSSGNISQNFSIQNQLSVLPLDESLTDVENFNTDDEPDFKDTPEADIDLDEYHSDYVKICTDLKQTHQNLVPTILETNELTDVESVPSDSESELLIKTNRTKRRKSRKNKGRSVPKIKKSISIPSYIGQQKGVDSDCSLLPKEVKAVLSDADDVKTNYKKLKNLGESSTGSETDVACLEGEVIMFQIPDIILPPAIRSLILLHENRSLVPSTEILPLDESRDFDIDDIAEGTTDTEFFEDDGLLTVETFKRGPSPEIYFFEDTSTYYGESLSKERNTDLSFGEHFKPTKNSFLGLPKQDDEPITDTEDLAIGKHGNQLNLPKQDHEPLTDTEDLADSGDSKRSKNMALNLPDREDEPITDTEDLAIADHPRRSKKTKDRIVNISLFNQLPTTDIEDFEFSDSSKSPLKKQPVVEYPDENTFVPYYMKEMDGTVTSSKDSDGTIVTKNILNITECKIFPSPVLTDVEDLAGSADEDIRPETATPSEFARHLEQQRSSKVHIESTKKLNLDSPTEIMYLKGGSYHQNHTDVEEMSDDNEWDVSKKSAPQEEASLAQDAEQQGEEPSFAASGIAQDSPLKVEGEESATGGQQTDRTSTQQRPITDQHQLSEEMKQLLKDLEKESKQ